ncbi:MAG: ORF6N domain-containing protein [Proteobacteria bacterium]|nr:ORF6N domain-containing protein [Pseudomonadota bacterium]MBU1648222.1 ORF6N domain-containing protein [Pseudomonadota bacterium]
MSRLINIEGRKIPPMFYQKRPVVTFQQVDELHQRKTNSAKQSFYRHRDKLIEGRDFFEVPFQEWSSLVVSQKDHQNVSLVSAQNTNQKSSLIVAQNDHQKASLVVAQNDHQRREKGGHRGSMIFLTETGYVMVIKPFTDDLSWAIYRTMAEAYFNKHVPNKPVSTAEIFEMQDCINNGLGVSETARLVNRARSTVKAYTRAERAERRIVAVQLSLPGMEG